MSETQGFSAFIWAKVLVRADLEGCAPGSWDVARSDKRRTRKICASRFEGGGKRNRGVFLARVRASMARGSPRSTIFYSQFWMTAWSPCSWRTLLGDNMPSLLPSGAVRKNHWVALQCSVGLLTRRPWFDHGVGPRRG